MDDTAGSSSSIIIMVYHIESREIAVNHRPPVKMFIFFSHASVYLFRRLSSLSYIDLTCGFDCPNFQNKKIFAPKIF